MKKLILIIPLILLASTLTAYLPQLVTFEWTYDSSTEYGYSADTFVLHTSDNVTTPLANWITVASIPAITNGVWRTNFSMPITPGLHFFYLTASNSFYGVESGPSNITNSPPAPELPRNVKLRR